MAEDAASCPGVAGGSGHADADGSVGGTDAGAPDATDAAGSGSAPCVNACTAGATQCASGSILRTCAVAANGCTAYTTSPCAAGTVCERLAPAACADPSWAEWPMPNGTADVSEGAPTLQHFVDNLDGTVTDTITGLIWEQAFHFADAGTLGEALWESLIVGGYSDWRMPTIVELVSLVDLGRHPTIDTSVFPLVSADNFWSSTHRMDFGEATLYVVDFFDGTMETGTAEVRPEFHASNLRCVR